MGMEQPSNEENSENEEAAVRKDRLPGNGAGGELVGTIGKLIGSIKIPSAD